MTTTKQSATEKEQLVELRYHIENDYLPLLENMRERVEGTMQETGLYMRYRRVSNLVKLLPTQ